MSERTHRCINDGGDGYECQGCHEGDHSVSTLLLEATNLLLGWSVRLRDSSPTAAECDVIARLGKAAGLPWSVPAPSPSTETKT